MRGDDGTVSIVQPLIAPLYGGRSVTSCSARSAAAAGIRLRHRARLERRRVRESREPAMTAPAASRRGRLARARRAPLGLRRTGGDGCTTASIRARVRPVANNAVAPGAAPATRLGKSCSPRRPERLRRTLRQQRLAAGAAEACHEADVGQRGALRRRRTRAARNSAATWRRGERGRRRTPLGVWQAPWISPAARRDMRSRSTWDTAANARGRIGTGIGFNVYALRTSARSGSLTGVGQVTKTGDSYELASTQDHTSMEGRDLGASQPRRSSSRIRDFAAKQEASRRRRCRCSSPRTRTTATRGAWRST